MFLTGSLSKGLEYPKALASPAAYLRKTDVGPVTGDNIGMLDIDPANLLEALSQVDKGLSSCSEGAPRFLTLEP